MNFHLVVVQAFGPHAKGAHVNDPADIAAILASDQSDHVVKIRAPVVILSEQEG